MFEWEAPTFDDYFRHENQKFWTVYSGAEQPLYWFSSNDMQEAATRKHDTTMLQYLKALEQYTDIAGTISHDNWDYPTRQQLEQRRQDLNSLLTLSRTHASDNSLRRKSGDLTDRWLLLEMRANMLLGNYADNIALWDKQSGTVPDGYIKEMMRNIYANALLHSGRKPEAWDIYARQNDNQSLLWSARKYTNLAGIKTLYRQYPDSPVLKYLIRRYINTIQDVVDMYYDSLYDKEQHQDNLDDALNGYWEDVVGKAYAPISKDFRKEIDGFVAFADSVAQNPSTADPCMWESAAALCSYFVGDYAQAKMLINRAMTMRSDADIKDMARRIRMLVMTQSEDITSEGFKKFITTELSWLDKEIDRTGSNAARHARDRVINLGLIKNLEDRKDLSTARLLDIARDYLNANADFITSTLIADIYPLSSDGIAQIYNTIDNPGNDPIIQYAASKISIPADLRNDILGTKLLQEGKWEAALPYLGKVSMDYLNQQPIAFYAARRDYHIPAWNGFQSVGDNDYEATTAPQHLSSNAKVDFCKEMIRLDNELHNASPARREQILLEQAAALYQASRFGQCWYLSQYGFSRYEQSPVTDSELAGLAIAKLQECARSNNPTVKAKALFGLAFAAPDQWLTEATDWSTPGYPTVTTIHRNSRQYSYYKQLNDLLRANPSVRIPEISRCDVIKQWQKRK